MKAILEVKRLDKIFNIQSGKLFEKPRKLYALHNVNLLVEPGTTLGIIGESGCGKSTLGRCIVKLYSISSGDIVYKGNSIKDLTGNYLKQYRKEVQMIFQDPFSSLNPKKTCFQLVEEPMLIHQLAENAQERKDRVIELLQEVGLNQYHIHRYPHEFSGGQRQRINIARALALNPELIVCDEPVSALDVSIQAQILNLFCDLQARRHLTYIFISHDLSVIKHISDLVVIMYLGQIVEICDTDSVYKNPLHPYTKALLSAIPPESPLEQKQEFVLKGELASTIGKPLSCSLCNRCPYATEKCRKQVPTLKTIAANHQVACFLYD